MRMWFNGRTPASQAGSGGSIPLIRSKKTRCCQASCFLYQLRRNRTQRSAMPLSSAPFVRFTVRFASKSLSLFGQKGERHKPQRQRRRWAADALRLLNSPHPLQKTRCRQASCFLYQLRGNRTRKQHRRNPYTIFISNTLESAFLSPSILKNSEERPLHKINSKLSVSEKAIFKSRKFIFSTLKYP